MHPSESQAETDIEGSGAVRALGQKPGKMRM